MLAPRFRKQLQPLRTAVFSVPVCRPFGLAFRQPRNRHQTRKCKNEDRRRWAPGYREIERNFSLLLEPPACGPCVACVARRVRGSLWGPVRVTHGTWPVGLVGGGQP